MFYTSIILIITTSEFFTPALAESLSLESDKQDNSSSLQNST